MHTHTRARWGFQGRLQCRGLLCSPAVRDAAVRAPWCVVVCTGRGQELILLGGDMSGIPDCHGRWEERERRGGGSQKDSQLLVIWKEISHLCKKKKGGGGEMWGTFWSFLFVCIVFLYGFKPLSKSTTAELGIWQFFYNTCFIFYLALL